MCGIAGIIGSTNIVNQSVAQTLARNLAHRGPDDQGIELLKPQQNPDTFIALVHRRLSIIDLTKAAHQPMKDPSTGNIIIYNSEVYNFKELRQLI
jgi:asparagine synthase (glutamine-hydrolysing)